MFVFELVLVFEFEFDEELEFEDVVFSWGPRLLLSLLLFVTLGISESA